MAKKRHSGSKPGPDSLTGKTPRLSQHFFDDDNGLVDVTFVVEEKPINFCKALLMVSSPVFERMFSSDFKEKEAQRIPLPEKTYSDFVVFLKQLHPAFFWATPLNDNNLEPMLKLSDEYDVKHIREKCVEFIRNQMELEPNYRRVLMYLRLSEAYNITDVRGQLMALAADQPIETLEMLPDFHPLEVSTKFELAKKRCQFHHENTGSTSSKLHKTAQAIRKLKLLASRLPGLIDGSPSGTLCISHDNTPHTFHTGQSTECVDRYKNTRVSTKTHLSRYCTECVTWKTELVIAYFHSLLGPTKDSFYQTISFDG